MVIGGRTGGIVKCRGQCLDPRAEPTAWATHPKTGGRLTQALAGTNPTTGQAAVTFEP